MVANNKFTLDLDLDEKEIFKSFAKEISIKINSVLFAMSKDGVIKSQVSQVLENQIRNTPEFDSLLSGDLSLIFGLEDSTKALSSIIQTVKDSIEIDITPVVINAGGLSASITVSLLRDDFKDVLALTLASYESDGGEVSWLKWLLTAGDAIVIADFDVKFGKAFIGSRTDFAIMERSNVGFRVPPEFSGTVNNNWLTRAVEGMEDLIGNILFVEINRRF